VRFTNRLTVDIAVPAELRDVLVPNLVLQPLVENALRHGLAEQEKAGHISIEANARDGLLRLVVRDDGAGLPPGWNLDRSAGVGLTNTRARLAHLYGEEASLDLFGEPGGSGTVAVVWVPLKQASRMP
jgi:LytS/YehU family sensor histidine kinase